MIFEVREQRAQPKVTGRRLKIWEIRFGLHCSIVGTCMSEQDIEALGERCRLKFAKDTPAHERHAYFVQQATSDNAEARAIQKLLDNRHAGMLRKLAACHQERAMADFWRVEFEAGRIAGAYWAIVTSTEVPTDLQTAIFGEVHMLSHVLGRTTHQGAMRASELQSRVEDLEARLIRNDQRHRESVRQFETKLASMASDRHSSSPAAEHDNGRSVARLYKAVELAQMRALKQQRAIVSARQRARASETEVAALRARIEKLELLLRTPSRRIDVPPCPAAEAMDNDVRRDVERRIIYVGGRTGGIEQLRQIASRLGADLVHHDGGEEHSVTRIDSMIAGCDAVFCPIDCVSHSACLRAKALCQKYNKRFVPLRSSGASTFERALTALGG